MIAKMQLRNVDEVDKAVILHMNSRHQLMRI